MEILNTCVRLNKHSKIQKRLELEPDEPQPLFT